MTGVHSILCDIIDPIVDAEVSDFRALAALADVSPDELYRGLDSYSSDERAQLEPALEQYLESVDAEIESAVSRLREFENVPSPKEWNSHFRSRPVVPHEQMPRVMCNYLVGLGLHKAAARLMLSQSAVNMPSTGSSPETSWPPVETEVVIAAEDISRRTQINRNDLIVEVLFMLIAQIGPRRTGTIFDAFEHRGASGLRRYIQAAVHHAAARNQLARSQGNEVVSASDRQRPRPLVVYLAGPSELESGTSRREQAELRTSIKGFFNRIGTPRFAVIDALEGGSSAEDFDVAGIYSGAMERMLAADLVFFCVSSPNFGVGLEAQIAADATVPRIVATAKNTTFGRLFTGLFGPPVAHIEYDNQIELLSKLTLELPRITASVVRGVEMRQEVQRWIGHLELGKEVFKQRIIRKMPLLELSERTGIHEFWLRQLEKRDDVASNLTVIQLTRLLRTIGATVSIGEGESTKRVDLDLSPESHESLENLATLCVSSSTWIPDELIFEAWSDYLRAGVSDSHWQHSPTVWSSAAWSQLVTDWLMGVSQGLWLPRR